MDWTVIIINAIVIAIYLDIRDHFRDARIKREANSKLICGIEEAFDKLIKEKQGDK